MSLEGTSVLLTGGAGFIGSHLAEALLQQRCRLCIVDNLDNFYLPQYKQANLKEIGLRGEFRFEAVDICDFPRLRAVVQEVKPEIVVHLAARAGVRPSIERPLLYERVNVGGTLNLLELAREFSVRRFIFGSSSSVYGTSDRVPFREEQPALHPISPYAATKLAGELTCYTYAHLYGIAVLCLRFFTVYGPRQRPDLAIHKFIAMIEADKPIPVFGDGSTGRDYTFVGDIVAGILAALKYDFPAQATSFDIFNLGNSHPVTLNQLIEHIEAATGRRAVRERKPLQPGDVPLTWADVSKASRLLGYRPGTQLGDGLRQFVEWYRTSGRSFQEAAG